ncbi:MAG: T9SS type A sorting domain-containing protein, partial [Bacteroidota bacterium]
GTTSLDDDLASFFSLYPNPVNSKLYLSFKDQLIGDLEVEIFDLQGRRQMYQLIRHPAEEISLSLSHLADGYYQVQLTANDQVYRLKLVKE